MKYTLRADGRGEVLVVDDVAANRFLYRALLEDDGHVVREASDGQACLREVARADLPRVELVLLDVSMPGMSGLDVLQALRARPDGGPAVLVLTAAARDPADIERGLELGADSYLTKPVDNRELAARVRAQLQIDRLRRELNSLRRDQTAMLVHDLRHPLSNLSMLAEVLEGEDVAREDRLHAAATLRRMVSDLSRLVDTILTASRLEAGVFDVVTAPITLGELVAPSVALLTPLALRRRVRFEVQLDSSLVLQVEAAKVRQVLDNLLSNALKFTPRTGTVRLEGHRTGRRVVLAVSDSGPGVGVSERAVIFDRYKQAPEGRTRGGAGLGLAIARGVVEAHGGTIACEAASLGGACFVFTLPLA
ncbi:MAG: response regulator [Myxococcales bacterium]|nr:response regulator [Myxococcales bacterium]